MHSQFSDHDPLLGQLKKIIAAKFRLNAGTADRLTPDEPLIGGILGLDSLDALALGLEVEEEFGITITSAAESRDAFASLASLAQYIRRHTPQHPLAA